MRALLVRFRSPSERESLWVDLTGLRPAPRLRRCRTATSCSSSTAPDYHVLSDRRDRGRGRAAGHAIRSCSGAIGFSDLIRWAGGFRPQANRSAMHLLRERGAGTERRSRVRPPGAAVAQRDDRVRVRQARDHAWPSARTASASTGRGSQAGAPTLDPLLQDERRGPRRPAGPDGPRRGPGPASRASSTTRPGRSLNDYIQLAGGFTERSARNSVRVSRALTGQVIPARSLKSVQPGDFIWVPERRDVDAWAVFRDIVTVAGQVAVIIFTLSRLSLCPWNEPSSCRRCGVACGAIAVPIGSSGAIATLVTGGRSPSCCRRGTAPRLAAAAGGGGVRLRHRPPAPGRRGAGRQDSDAGDARRRVHRRAREPARSARRSSAASTCRRATRRS